MSREIHTRKNIVKLNLIALIIRTLILKTVILMGLVSSSAFAAPANTKQEIQHLLNYVANTDCQYERNGTIHTGGEAVKHIKKKYNYYSDDIESTEDFIKFSATKSKMSGKKYMIHCNDKQSITSKDWLLSELKNYRTLSD